MKKIIYSLLIFTAFTAHSASADNRGNSLANVTAAEAMRKGNAVDMDMTITYDKVVVGPNQQLILTPMIAKGADTLELQPVVLIGKTRAEVNSRMVRLNNGELDYENPYKYVEFNKREIRKRRQAVRSSHTPIQTSQDVVNYRTQVPYQNWMDGSTVLVKQELTGCGPDSYPYYATVGNIANPVPAMITLIVPEYEVEKRREEKMTSYINFEQGKYEIKRSVANNDRELDRIYDFTERIRNNDDYDIRNIKIKGFASPEGSYASNNTLSRNRVNAIRDNLASRYSLDHGMFLTENEPEDWDSLRRWVAASDIQYRSQILDIIDNTSDPDARDGKIRSLDGSKTYNMLLKDVYPQLRRVDYAIDYAVMPYTVDRGRTEIRTNPQNMSLHEIYMVAESYPHDSPEYIYAFETAARYYPNDPVANNNMAAAALKRGDLPTAKQYLQKAGNDPRALNNLGVIAVREGNYRQAQDYFTRSANAGNEDARFNLSNLDSLE